MRLCTHRVVVVFFFTAFFGFRTREAHQGGWESALLTSVNMSATCLLLRAYLLPIGVFMFKIVYPKQFDLSKRNPGFILFHVSCCSYLSLSKQLILVIQVSRRHTVHF